MIFDDSLTYLTEDCSSAWNITGQRFVEYYAAANDGRFPPVDPLVGGAWNRAREGNFTTAYNTTRTLGQLKC